MKKIGFVTPWYGDRIPGGAEMETRELVKHLVAAGIECEILTTCAEKFASDWNKNYYRPGYTLENSVPVRRFKVRKRNAVAFDQINKKLMQNERINMQDEKVFVSEMINSPELYSYMEKRQSEYSCFVFIPYMFGTTYFGCQICPEKSILIPCLHDESYAYMQLFQKAYANVRGMVFNALPEEKLAEKLYGVHGENFRTIGIGVEEMVDADAMRFKKKYHISEPFILYAGRKEKGKKVDVLLENFTRFKKNNPSSLKLILIGGGKIEIPSDDIIDLGFVSVEDKCDAYAAATLFCNPSQFESFSLVIMESWLARRPVLVNGDCRVTRNFVSQSNGGLYYENYSEFEKCISWILNHQREADQMGCNGQNFVRNNFTWNVIVGRYKDYFEKMEKK